MPKVRCGASHRSTKIKWAPLIVLALLCFLFFHFRLQQYLTLNTIKNYHTTAQQWTMLHYKSAVSLYILIFVILVACAIPCATILALLGGFLFGIVALIYADVGTTVGGMILFLAIRTSIGAHIAAKSTGWIKKMEYGFQQNAFHYLLMLRLVPIFPCWVSNVAAGVSNIPLRTFILATALGITPATFIYVMVGRSLDQFITNESASLLSILLRPSILLPFLGLAFLSLFPVIYKYFKQISPNEKM